MKTHFETKMRSRILLGLHDVTSKRKLCLEVEYG